MAFGWRRKREGGEASVATSQAVTVDPLTLVRAGAPSAEFMGAAANWNAATFHDTGDGTAYSSVDIPTTTLDSGSVAAPEDPGNPNGSLRGIAGVQNAAGNVAGLMPHPETATEAILGSDDGLGIIRSLVVSAGEFARDGRISLALPRQAENLVPVGQVTA